MNIFTVLLTAIQLANPSVAPPRLPLANSPVPGIVREVREAQRQYPKAPAASIYRQIKLRYQHEKRVLTPARKQALKRTLAAEMRRRATQTSQQTTRSGLSRVTRIARALPMFRALRLLRLLGRGR